MRSHPFSEVFILARGHLSFYLLPRQYGFSSDPGLVLVLFACSKSLLVLCARSWADISVLLCANVNAVRLSAES